MVRHSTYHLLSRHTDGLSGELAPTHVEEVFEVRPKKIDDKDIVESLLSEMVHLRNADCLAGTKG